MNIGLLVVIAGAVICAVQAIRAARLLVSAIWLAGVSALVAAALYRLGAAEVAVIELSVGAGLVTVLFVFAISIAGEDAMRAASFVPRRAALGLVIAAAALLAVMALPAPVTPTPPGTDTTFRSVLWEQRSLDVLLQIGLIFCGVIGILGLLVDPLNPDRPDESETA